MTAQLPLPFDVRLMNFTTALLLASLLALALWLPLLPPA